MHMPSSNIFHIMSMRECVSVCVQRHRWSAVKAECVGCLNDAEGFIMWVSSGPLLCLNVTVWGQPGTYTHNSQSEQFSSSSLCKHLCATVGTDRNSSNKGLKRSNTHIHTVQDLWIGLSFLFPHERVIKEVFSGLKILFLQVIQTTFSDFINSQ